MQKLDLDALGVESFSTAADGTVPIVFGPPTTVTVPYSLLGSCYGCPSNVTVCATTEGGTA